MIRQCTDELYTMIYCTFSLKMYYGRENTEIAPAAGVWKSGRSEEPCYDGS